MFESHVVELVPVACSRRSDGNPPLPLAMTWVVPQRVMISLSSQGTRPGFQDGIVR